MVTATVPVGVQPRGIAITPDGGQLYVANISSSSVSVIDTGTQTVTSNVPVGLRGNFAVQVTPDGKSAYVVRQFYEPADPNLIYVVDTTTNEVTQAIPFKDPGDGFTDIAFTPDGKRLYLVNDGRNAVSVLDTSGSTFVATFPIEGDGPSGMAVSPDGAFAYTTNFESSPIHTASGTVAVIDTSTNTLVRIILRVGNAPTSIALRRLEPDCGNGVLDPGEECDDGNLLGGDGCAPNCTVETARTMTFDPAVSRVEFYSTTAGTFSGNVSGTLTIRTGTAGASGSIPVAIRAEDARFNPVPVAGLGCVCLQAVADPDLAPGVAGHGDIGCSVATIPQYSINNVAYINGQVHDSSGADPDCFRGTREPPTGKHPGVCNGPRKINFYEPGPPGSAVFELNLRTRWIADGGTCAVDSTDPAKGADGIPCNEDDPDTGMGAQIGPLTTAGSRIDGASGGVTDLQGNVAAVFVTGSAFDCTALTADPTGATGGVTLVSVAPVLDSAIGDYELATVFAAEPVTTPTPTATPSPTQTPTSTMVPTGTSSPTVSPSATSTLVPTPTLTATMTPSTTATVTATATGTVSATASATFTGTPTPTNVPTATQTQTAVVTPATTSGDDGCSIVAGERSRGWPLLLPVAVFGLARLRFRAQSRRR